MIEGLVPENDTDSDFVAEPVEEIVIDPADLDIDDIQVADDDTD